MAVLEADIRARALAAANVLAREGQVVAAYVFGSRVQGRADEWSDIDVAVFIEGAETWDAWQKVETIVRVQEEVGFDVEPHIFPASALRHPQPGCFAGEILRHGVRVR